MDSKNQVLLLKEKGKHAEVDGYEKFEKAMGLPTTKISVPINPAYDILRSEWDLGCGFLRFDFKNMGLSPYIK